MVAVPALPDQRHQPCLDELAKMAAGRLGADPAVPGELARGERTPVHQCQEDVGARRVADEGTGLRQRVA